MLATVDSVRQGASFLPRPPEADEVHVLAMPLDLDRHRRGQVSACLSRDEWERAERFRFALHRDRFAAARGWLRRILGSCLDVAPERVRLRYGRHGKPELDAELSRSGLRFNVSHSEGLGLCAVARGREVGVDLERVKPLPDLEAVARHFFSRRERSVLQGMRDEERLPGFYACWTRKEAFIKATGEGLARPLDRFDVSLEGPARLERVAGDPEEADRWSLVELRPAGGFAAALAVEGPLGRLSVGTVAAEGREADLRPSGGVPRGGEREAR
jgi:4'-phosphopantetheinyl transferase